MPLLEHNINQNDKFFSSASTLPQAVVLDWDEDELPPRIQGVEGGYDVIMCDFSLKLSGRDLRLSYTSMADVTYNTASFPVLIRTLRNLIGLHTPALKAQSPLILMGYKERDSAERTLWDLARDIGVEFSRVGERAGAGGAPVEIWLGQLVQES